MKKIDSLKIHCPGLITGMKGMLAVMLVMLMAVGNLFADQVTWVLADAGYTNGQELGSGTINEYVSFSSAQGDASNPPKYYTSGTAARLYSAASTNGNAFTLIPAAGTIITGVEITGSTDFLLPMKYNVDGGDDVDAVLNDNIYSIAAVNAQTGLTFRNANTASSGNLRVVSLTVYYTPGTAPAVMTPVIAPEGGLYYSSQNVSITCGAEDARILYTVDGSDPKVAGTEYTASFAVSANTTVRAIAYADTDTSYESTVNYTFPIEVANIAAFKNAETFTGNSYTGGIYHIAGDVIVAAQIGSYLFVKDATAALIYYGNISNIYHSGDTIRGGLYGTYTGYNGLVEMSPLAALPQPTEGIAGTAVQPVVATVAQINADYNAYDSQLITIETARFTSTKTYTEGTAGAGAPFTQGDDAMLLYNTFKTLDMTVNEYDYANITGFLLNYRGTAQIIPRGNEDIETVIVPATLPINITFDDPSALANWVLDNGTQTNKWYIGQGQSFDNNKLFISSTNGATNKYNVSSTSTVHFYRDIIIPASGATLSFDYRSMGEKNWDYLLVSVLNAEAPVVAGTSLSSTIDTLGMQPDWRTYSYEFAQSAEDHTVRLVFSWHNDSSAGTQTPAAIDNISVTNFSCVAPSNVAVTVDADGHGALITWNAVPGINNWLVQYKWDSYTEYYTIPVNTNQITLSNLQSNSLYELKIKAVCGDNASDFTTIFFNTPCEHGYGVARTITDAATITTSGNFIPMSTTSNYSYSQQLYPVENFDSTALLIRTVAFKTTSPTIKTRNIVIYMANVAASAIPANGFATTGWVPADQLTEVYSGEITVTSDEQGGWNHIILTTPFNYNGTDNLVVVVNDITGSTDDGGVIYFETFATRGVYSALYKTAASAISMDALGSGIRVLRKNIIMFNGLCDDTIPACSQPSELVVGTPSPASVDLSWTSAGEETSWLLEYRENNATEWTSLIINSNPYTLSGLNERTTYNVRLANYCGEYNYSEYIYGSDFTTPAVCEDITDISFSTAVGTVFVEWVPADENQNLFELQYKLAASDTWSPSIMLSTTSTMLSGLNEGAEYNVRVRTICGDYHSLWANITLMSACAALPTPYSEYFNEAAPACWTSINNSWTFDGETAVSTIAEGAAETHYLVSPAIIIPEEDIVQFRYAIPQAANYDVMISVRGTDPASFRSIYHGETNAIVVPDEYAGQTVYFAVVHTAPGTITLDNVVIAGCADVPFDLTYDNVTAGTVDLAWDAAEEIHRFAVVSNLGGTYDTVFVDNAHEYTLTGLTEDTLYSVEVISICDGNMFSAPSEPVSFTTEYFCPRPVSLVRADYDYQSVTFEWQAAGTETSWIFEYRFDEEDAWTVANTDEASYSIGGLTENTDYTAYVRVRANCGDGAYKILYTTRTSSFTTEYICPAPTNITAENITAHSITFSWTPEGTENAWNVQYVSGTDTFNNIVSTPYYTISGLSTQTSYVFDVKVQAICEGSYIHVWSPFNHFAITTPCEPYTLPFFEDFSSTTFPADCWKREHTAGSSANTWIRTTSTTHSTPGAAQLQDQNSGNVNILVTPPLSIAAPNSTEVSFWVYRSSGYCYYENEGIKVWAGPNANTTGATELMYIRRCYSQIPVETSTGWYKYSAVVPNSGEVYIIFEGISEFGAATYMDDISVEYLPTCSTPKDLDFDLGTLTFSWAAGTYGTPLSYTVEYGIVDDPNINTLTTTELQSTLSNLLPSTDYQVRVKANCGVDDESAWSDYVAFLTPCEPYTVPFTEDFSSTDFPPVCWTREHTAGTATGTWIRTTSTTYSTPGAAQLQDQQIGNVNNLVTPPFTVAAANTVQVSFWVYRSTYSSLKENEGFKVWAGPNPNTTGATELMYVHREFTLSPAEASIGWYEYSVAIPNAGLQYIIFEGISEYGTATYLDDVTVEYIPSCPKPTQLAFDGNNTTETAIPMSWTAGGSETEWILDYTVNGVTTSVVVNNTPSYTITGLSAGTTYSIPVSVRGVCSASDTSRATSRTLTATTLCPLAFNLPYSENFDSKTGGSGVLPNCWTRINTGTSSTTNPYVYNYNSYSSPNALYFYIYYSGSYSDQYAVLPNVNISNASLLQLSCWAKESSTSSTYVGNIEVGVMTDPADASTFVSVGSIQPTTTSYVKFNVSFDSYTGNGTYVALKAVKPSSGYNVVYLDDLLLERIPNCSAPVSLSYDGTALSWLPGPRGTASSYTVRYRMDSEENYTIVTSNTTSAAISSLAPSTTYVFQVLANCVDGETTESSAWSEVYTYTTPCLSFTLPFNEDFETSTTSMPACWSQEQVVGTSNWVFRTGTVNSSGVTTAHSGSYNAAFAHSTTNNKTKLISPVFDLSAVNAADLSFWHTQKTWGSDQDELTVYYRTGISSPWIELANFDNNIATWTQETINLVGLPAAYYQLAFEAYDKYGYGISLDDISIQRAAACSTPEDLTFNLMTSTLSWTPGLLGPAISYNVQYRADSDESFTSFTVTDTFSVFSSLVPSTTYIFKVQAICEDGTDTIFSNWTDEYSCTTFSMPAVVPYSHDFENEEENGNWQYVSGSSVNTWNIGTATQNGGSKSIYVSNDNGTSNTYNMSSTSTVAAVRLLSFQTPGVYSIAFDWKSEGEGSNWDFARVCLVPANEMITSTSLPSRTSISGSTHPATWLPVDGGINLLGSDEWTTVTSELAVSTPTMYNLVLYWNNDGSGGTNPPAAIDNISITQVACPRPTAIVVDTVTENSVTIGWTPLGSETTWQVAYILGTDTVRTTVNDPHLIIGSLTPATVYSGVKVGVAAVCSAEESDFATATLGFATLCVDPALPFMEDFNDQPTGSSSTILSLLCWDRYNTYSTSYVYPYVTTTNSEKALYFYSSGSTYNIAALPLFTEDINNLKVGFKLRASSLLYNLKFGVITDPTDISTFVEIGTYSPSATNTWDSFELLLNRYTGPAGQLAFVGDRRAASAYNYIYLDDVTVELLPTCISPVNLTYNNVLATSAELTWESLDDETAWIIEYKPATDTVWMRANATSNPTTLSGLEAATTYDVRVLAKCSDTDNSDPSDAVTFKTRYSIDLALASVTPIYDACSIENVPVVATVKNLETTPVTSFTISYIANDGDVVSEVVTPETPLLKDSILVHTFAQTVSFTDPTNHITVWTDLEGDFSFNNDTIKATNIKVVEPFDYPYPVQTFTGVTLDKNGWRKYDLNGDNITWTASGTARYTYNDLLDANDWIITPCYHLLPGTYELSHDFAALSNLTESFEVYLGTSATVADMTTLIESHTVNGTANNHHSAVFTITTEGNYNFGIKATSLLGNMGIVVDNLSVDPLLNLFATTDGNGTITPNSETEPMIVRSGSSTSFIIMPNDGYSLEGIYVNGESVLTGNNNARIINYTHTIGTSNDTVYVQFAASQYTMSALINNYNNINYYNETTVRGTIQPNFGTVTEGDDFIVTGTVDEHFHLADLTVDGVSDFDNVVVDGQNFSYTISNVTAGHDVIAYVAIDEVLINYNIVTGAGLVDGMTAVAPDQIASSVYYDYNHSSTFEPAENYYIVNVVVNGDAFGPISQYTFNNVVEPQNVDVYFGYKVDASIRNYNTYYEDPSIVAGAILPATKLVPAGYAHTVIGMVDEHFHLYNLFVNGVDMIEDVIFNENYFLYTLSSVDENTVIDAVVKVDTFAIVCNVTGGHGTVADIAVTNDTLYNRYFNFGDNYVATVASDFGYHIVNVNVDGIDYGPIQQWTFLNIIENHYLTVTLAPNEYTVTTRAFGNGTISGSQTFVYDDPDNTYNLTVTPATGCYINRLLVNGEIQNIARPDTAYNYVYTPIAMNYAIDAYFSVYTYTINATAGANGMITPNGATVYNYGANATYSATANYGYYISKVTVDGVETEYTQDDNMLTWNVTFNTIIENHAVSVEFANFKYTITVNAGTHGTISPSEAVTAAFGTSQTFTIMPESGYYIATLTVDGQAVTPAASYTFTNVQADHSIAATFTNVMYTINATAGVGGSVSPAGISNVVMNSNLTYTVTPEAHYVISELVVDGTVLSPNTTYTFTNVTANHTFRANFELEKKTITVTQPLHGNITPGTTMVEYGASQMFTVTPDMGYVIDKIKVNNTDVPFTANILGVATYTFNNVQADANFTAVMKAKVYTITTEVNDVTMGTITPTDNNVQYGTNKTVTITPNAHYEISDVKVDGRSVGAVASYVFRNVADNHSIKAYFSYIPCDVPSNLNTTNITTEGATIRWTGPADASYVVKYKTINSTNWTSANTNVNSYDLTNLLSNTEYLWTVKTVCATNYESDWAAQISFRTLYNVGIADASLETVKVYSNLNNVYIENESNVRINQVDVYDMYGKIIYTGVVNNSPEIINLSVANGNYIVRLMTEQGVGTYKVHIAR